MLDKIHVAALIAVSLTTDREPLDQNIHGNDFWQTDYDPTTSTWSRTYNLPRSRQEAALIEFAIGQYPDFP